MPVRYARPAVCHDTGASNLSWPAVFRDCTTLEQGASRSARAGGHQASARNDVPQVA